MKFNTLNPLRHVGISQETKDHLHNVGEKQNFRISMKFNTLGPFRHVGISKQIMNN